MVQKKGAKETEENPGLAHRTVSSAPGSVQAELSTFGNLESRSSMIHRTVGCAKRSNGRQRNGRVQRSADNATVRGQFVAPDQGTLRLSFALFI